MSDQLDPQIMMGHVLSFGALVGVFMNHLPQYAAGATLVWTLLCIYQSRPVQELLASLGWIKPKRDRRASDRRR